MLLHRLSCTSLGGQIRFDHQVLLVDLVPICSLNLLDSRSLCCLDFFLRHVNLDQVVVEILLGSLGLELNRGQLLHGVTCHSLGMLLKFKIMSDLSFVVRALSDLGLEKALLLLQVRLAHVLQLLRANGRQVGKSSHSHDVFDLRRVVLLSGVGILEFVLLDLNVQLVSYRLTHQVDLARAVLSVVGPSHQVSPSRGFVELTVDHADLVCVQLQLWYHTLSHVLRGGKGCSLLLGQTWNVGVQRLQVLSGVTVVYHVPTLLPR